MGLLADKAAIITGGVKGAGRAIAETFAREGAYVLISTSRDLRDAEAAARKIEKLHGRRAVGVKCDVSDEGEVEAMVSRAVQEFGGIDVLVNNASFSVKGGWKAGIENLDVAAWRRAIDVDLTGTLLCTRSAAPHLKKRRGSVVNFASSAAIGGDPVLLMYSGAKVGMVGLTRALARDMAPETRVNAIAPGSIDSGWIEAWGLTEAEKRELIEEIPLKRIGTPADIAEAALFLASGESSYITGYVLRVDGGMTIG
ncbi:MAG: glucose 1-dehydrogenase [Euryarchaeota archaeon]|nr:glucose 1-dehydrogenase [Euryarchaeota archaeon]